MQLIIQVKININLGKFTTGTGRNYLHKIICRKERKNKTRTYKADEFQVVMKLQNQTVIKKREQSVPNKLKASNDKITVEK